MLSFFIDAASGALAVLPFLIILEIAARRLIPFLPLRHLVGEGMLSFLLAALLSIAQVPGLYEFCADLRFSLTPFSQIPLHPLWYALYFLFFSVLGAMLPLLFSFFQKMSVCILYGLGFALLIELLRVFTLHTSGVDALIAAAAGAFCGYALFLLIRRLFPAFCSSCLLTADCLSIHPSLKWESVMITLSALGSALLFAPLIREAAGALFL